MAPPSGEFTERERWRFDNDGVIVVPDAISPCAHSFLSPCHLPVVIDSQSC